MRIVTHLLAMSSGGVLGFLMAALVRANDRR